MKVAMKVIKHLITKYCDSNYITQLKLNIVFVLFNKDFDFFFFPVHHLVISYQPC